MTKLNSAETVETLHFLHPDGIDPQGIKDLLELVDDEVLSGIRLTVMSWILTGTAAGYPFEEVRAEVYVIGAAVLDEQVRRDPEGYGHLVPAVEAWKARARAEGFDL